jgi:hypothetical protein
MIAGAVLFGPHGMDPRDVPRLLSAGSAPRAFVIAVAIAILRANVRTMLFPPGATWVRASPTPRFLQFGVAALACLLLPLPLVMLFAVGRAPIDGIGLGFAITSACVASSAIGFVVAAVVGIVCAPLAPIVFVALFPRAYRAAPVTSSWHVRVRLEAPFLVLLASAHVRALIRAGVTRLTLAGVVPAALAYVVARGDEPAKGATVATPIVAAFAAAPLLEPVLRTHRAVAPEVRASSRSRRAAWLIAIALLATPALAFAATVPSVSRPASLAEALAIVTVIATLHAHLRGRRPDGGTIATLWSLPIVILLAFAPAPFLVSAVAFAVAFMLPEPEVLGADR